ncbi:ThiF family adenylyltransferase [Paenibacillus arenilitoris]|uniref:ThiF family adenylyltransferase n=1 Tax=Paenibacillus arenilitoris TaxID=2772299 RepID=A0A927CS10_9BACL|nr:ThiF family adenylyltransferase [Paenibacillus arenilitoris]MBD2872562.1 ThiF family adenylyltransferase [Paenibacillus arenilitoris]
MAEPFGTAWGDRYSRQIRFAPIGEAGQRELAGASVLIVGVGALGAALAQHMVRAGVGEVRLVDRDFVEASNLQRQTLFDEADAMAALPKAVAAASKLRAINGDVRVEARVADVNEANAAELADGARLVLDGTDNAATRLLLSDVCFRARIPFIYGGVAGAQGMSAALLPGETSCLRCLIGDADEGGDTCDTVGVLAPAVEFIASLQAAEALKWLTGNKDAMRRTWLSADLWSFRLRESAMPGGRADCPHCGAAETLPESAAAGAGGRPEEEISSAALCGRDTVQVTLGKPLPLDRLEQELRSRGCELTVNRYLIRARLGSGETLVLFPDGRALVQGTADAAHAVRLCEAYVLGRKLPV